MKRRIYHGVKAAYTTGTWTHGGRSYFWNGPGSRVFVRSDGRLEPISHEHDTWRDAEAAVRRFADLPARAVHVIQKRRRS